MGRNCLIWALSLCAAVAPLGAQQVGAQDLARILERADRLLEEAKSAYEEARAKSAVAGFIDAGFKLEEARIKYLVLQEIGAPEHQKTAADRLRAVNQLTKLVHDGKIAVSGTPAESRPKPLDPANPAPEPPPPSPAPPDVTKRFPVPDASQQRETEKQVRELFKEEYAKKAAADRKLLARRLLEQAAKSQADPAALWVLYREAQDVAGQAGDLDAGAAAVEGAVRLFDVDGLSMKTSLLAAVGKGARTPDELFALAEAQVRHVEDLVLVDQYDAADKMATAAVQFARKSGDEGLLARATARSKEVAEARTLYQAQKRVLETLAKNPEDAGANLEMGKFLCFVKGQWDLGIRFLVKGSDPALKGLAERELAASVLAPDRAALADGWFDLAEKEKSPLRKSQMQAHAKAVYESALVDAPPLLRARVEKRLESFKQAVSPSGTVDLLRLIDVSRDSVGGEWAFSGRSLVCVRPVRCARLQVPYEPPEEYDVTVVAERKEGSHVLYVGLARGSTQFYVGLDDWLGTVSGIGWVDNATTKDNETAVPGKVFTNNKPCAIVCAVRKDGITVTVDGRKLTSFKGDFSRLSNDQQLVMPNRRVLWIGATDCRFVISKYSVTPISGPGKIVR